MLDVLKILVALSSALQFSLIIFLWIYKQYLINRNNRALRALSRARRESLERYLDELEDESPRTISYVFTVVWVILPSWKFSTLVMALYACIYLSTEWLWNKIANLKASEELPWIVQYINKNGLHELLKSANKRRTSFFDKLSPKYKIHLNWLGRVGNILNVNAGILTKGKLKYLALDTNRIFKQTLSIAH